MLVEFSQCWQVKSKYRTENFNKTILYCYKTTMRPTHPEIIAIGNYRIYKKLKALTLNYIIADPAINNAEIGYKIS